MIYHLKGPKLNELKSKLEERTIYLHDDQVLDHPSIIGYDKEFRWSFLASQLNTFVIATDFNGKLIDVDMVKQHLDAGYAIGKQNYKGWPIGLQAGLATISILYSNKISPEAQEYCEKIKFDINSDALFTIPVVVNSETGEYYCFANRSLVGIIYQPYIKKFIESLLNPPTCDELKAA